MSKPAEIARLIQTIANANNNVAKVAMFDAVVVEVQSITCTIERQGLQYSARLCAAFDSSESQVIIKPKTGSSVLVGDLSDGLLRDLVILSCSDVEVVLMNGGHLGGMVKIEALTNKLNALAQSVNNLITAYNSHTHAVATTGTEAAQSGTAAPTTSTARAADTFKASDYEDTKILH